MANIDDLLMKASSGNNTAVLATVLTDRASGDRIIQCSELAGWSDETAVTFATFKIDPTTGGVQAGTQMNMKGLVNTDNNTITEIEINVDTPDQGNDQGDYVMALPTAQWANDLVTGLFNTLTPKGELKERVVKEGDLADDSVGARALQPASVTTDALAESAVTASKLAPTILAFGNYSTSEVNTGFTWIDGKAIYKRTFSFDRGTGTTYSLTIPSGVEDVIMVEGFIKATSGPNSVPLSYAGGTINSYISYFRNSTTTIRFDAGADFTATYRNVRATIYYTKV